MLIQRLVELAARGSDAGQGRLPLYYGHIWVRYRLELGSDGCCLGLIDLAQEADGKKNGKRHPAPSVKRSSGIRPQLLCDKSDYVLGLTADGGSEERTRKAHASFVELARRCAEETRLPGIASAVSFLESGHLPDLPTDFAPGAAIMISVDGTILVDLPEVQKFWADWNQHDYDGDESMGQCLGCGNRRSLLDRLPTAIKGFGGQSAGVALISANESAFESYGLEASRVAPICVTCALAFTEALNRLGRSDQSSLRLAGSTLVFWTRSGHTFDIKSVLEQPAPGSVRRLIGGVQDGRRRDVEEDRFFAAMAHGSGGRLVVRGWIDAALADVAQSIERWFERTAIVGNGGEDPVPLSIRQLMTAVVRDLGDAKPNDHGVLVRAALLGERLPPSWLVRSLQRCRIEGGVTRPRAAIIKVALGEEDGMIELSEGATNVGYLCGRLLAVLAHIQYAVNGSSSVGERGFASASTTPAAALPRYLRAAQAHLGKLRRDKPPAFFANQQRLEGILSSIGVDGSFPATLSIEDQGRFALGYYHERAARRKRITEAKETQEGEEE